MSATGTAALFYALASLFQLIAVAVMMDSNKKALGVIRDLVKELISQKKT